jgi:uncharacterized DUF497 family protein
VSLLPDFFPNIEGFQWDVGNASKNWTRHRVSQTEAEQVFLNRPLIVVGAPVKGEVRQFAFGRTEAGRFLTVVFTLRGSLLRVISVRPISRRERRGYGKANDA